MDTLFWWIITKQIKNCGYVSPHLPISISFSGFDDFHLSIHTDMATVAKAMACPESGLEVRDRMWLKITIANAFIGMSGTLHFEHC